MGDAIFVTGPLGGSLLGRHLDVVPRVREALALREFVTLHAMIDISDGFAADLTHLLIESAVGAELDAEVVPIHADAVTRSGTTGRTALDHALNDGEDFELIFTVSESDAARLVAGSPVSVVRVGRVVPGAGITLVTGGVRSTVTPGGWVHAV